jgi:hypothetical protein
MEEIKKRTSNVLLARFNEGLSRDSLEHRGERSTTNRANKATTEQCHEDHPNDPPGCTMRVSFTHSLFNNEQGDRHHDSNKAKNNQKNERPVHCISLLN